VAHKLMLLDPSPAVQRLVEQAAQADGFETTCFKDTASALDAVGELKPSVIIAAYELAGTTFISFCERLAGMEFQPNPPIVALVSPSDRFDEPELRFLGVKAFLQKPLQRDDVLHVIKQLGSALAPAQAGPQQAGATPRIQAKAEKEPARQASSEDIRDLVAREVGQHLQRILPAELPAQIAKAYPREDMTMIAMDAVQQAIPDIAAQLISNLRPIIQQQVAEMTERLVKEAVEAALRKSV
jgi:CheY-like chemotaxis protein